MMFWHKYFINIKLLLKIHWLLVDTSVDKRLTCLCLLYVFDDKWLMFSVLRLLNCRHFVDELLMFCWCLEKVFIFGFGCRCRGAPRGNGKEYFWKHFIIKYYSEIIRSTICTATYAYVGDRPWRDRSPRFLFARRLEPDGRTRRGLREHLVHISNNVSPTLPMICRMLQPGFIISTSSMDMDACRLHDRIKSPPVGIPCLGCLP